MILNLPYDDEFDNIETAHLLNALNVEEVKDSCTIYFKGNFNGAIVSRG